MKLNNKGFTLVEILAVIAIIGILGLVAIPSVLSTINTGKNASYKVMISNIVTSSKSLYEEVEYGEVLYKYNNCGVTSDEIKIEESGNTILVNLQTLVSNGFLSGTNNSSSDSDLECEGNVNKNTKKIIDPGTKEDLGDCEIKIIKSDNAGKISYSVINNSSDAKCPSDYKEV